MGSESKATAVDGAKKVRRSGRRLTILNENLSPAALADNYSEAQRDSETELTTLVAFFVFSRPALSHKVFAPIARAADGPLTHSGPRLLGEVNRRRTTSGAQRNDEGDHPNAEKPEPCQMLSLWVLHRTHRHRHHVRRRRYHSRPMLARRRVARETY